MRGGWYPIGGALLAPMATSGGPYQQQDGVGKRVRFADFLSLLCGCVGQSLTWQAQNFPWTRFPDSGYALPRLTFPAI